MKCIWWMAVAGWLSMLNADAIYRCNPVKAVYTNPKGVEEPLGVKAANLDFAHYGDHLKSTAMNVYNFRRRENGYSLYRIADDEYIDDTVYINVRNHGRVMMVRHNSNGGVITFFYRCNVKELGRDQKIIFRDKK